jgi:Lrp/AsnC family transcriptional regulator, regulator for asnA, asnC and gidA
MFSADYSSNIDYANVKLVDIRIRMVAMTDQPSLPSQPPPEHAGPGILDEIDQRVIKILQIDGRRPNTEIARELRVSETTVRKRISQLVSRGFINIVAVPTPRAIGMNLSAIIGISVTLPRLQDISEELKRQREVRYVGVSTGRYDIIVEAFFFDQRHFLDFISNRLGRMQGITGVETSVILDVVKFSYEWEIA